MNYRHVYMLIIKHAKSEMELGLRPKSRYEKGISFQNVTLSFITFFQKAYFQIGLRESQI